MSQLKIRIANSEVPPDSQPLLGCVLRRKNLACDELSAEFKPTPLSKSWKYGDPVEVFDSNRRVFRGKISQTTAAESGAQDSVKILAKNAFEELEQIVYQQSTMAFSNGVLAARKTSRVVLGKTKAGAKISLAKQAKDIIDYAVELGADLRAGTIDIDAEMVFDECRDISCAEALCRVLKWSPSCRLFFDYSGTGTPTVNILKRAALGNVSVETRGGLVKKYSAKSRDDLSVNAVSIKYERESSVGGDTYLEFFEDNYPKDAASEKKSIVMNVELAGAKSAIESCTVKTQTIRPESKQWWKDHVAYLADIDDFEIAEYSREGSLGYELVEGCISPAVNCRYERDTVKAQINYADELGSSVSKIFAVKMLTTTAQTGTYTRRTLSQTTEPVPTGLAKAVYLAASPVLYDGFVQIIGGKSGDFFGKCLRLTSNGTPVTTETPVYATEENFGENTLNVKFGPSKHLYPDNIVELFRINRCRKTSTLTLDSDSGKISASTSVSISAVPETQASETSALYSRMVIKNQDKTKVIDINSEALSSGETLALRECYVCESGYLAKAKFFMTEPARQ